MTQRQWHLIDVKEKILGRVATEIASLLTGKGKPNFSRNQDIGDFVVVINSREVKVSGKKEGEKKYYRHSGYPGGLKVRTLRELRSQKPSEIIIHAVKGMLPQNRLRDRMLGRLFVFAGDEHPYQDKLVVND